MLLLSQNRMYFNRILISNGRKQWAPFTLSNNFANLCFLLAVNRQYAAAIDLPYRPPYSRVFSWLFPINESFYSAVYHQCLIPLSYSHLFCTQKGRCFDCRRCCRKNDWVTFLAPDGGGKIFFEISCCCMQWGVWGFYYLSTLDLWNHSFTIFFRQMIQQHFYA